MVNLKQPSEAGHYARKQLLCKNPVIVWSHAGRFITARQILERQVLAQQVLEGQVGRSTRLLDYGCGDGTFLAMMSDLFPHSVGADIAPEQIADCQQRLAETLPNTRFCLTTDLSDDRSLFDAALCMEVLEHCLPNNVERVLTDLQRLVKPGGVILISVPIEIGPSLVLKQSLRAVAGWLRQGDYDKITEFYTRAEFLKMVFADGSTAIDRFTYGSGETAYHGHQGFNWRALRRQVSQQFVLERTVFSPVNGLGSWINSQVFFVCRNPQNA